MPSYEFKCDECTATYTIEAAVKHYAWVREIDGSKHEKCLNRPPGANRRKKGRFRRVFSTFTFHMG